MAVSYGLCVVRVIKLQWTQATGGYIQKQTLYLPTLNPHRGLIDLINELTAVCQGSLLIRLLN